MAKYKWYKKRKTDWSRLVGDIRARVEDLYDRRNFSEHQWQQEILGEWVSPPGIEPIAPALPTVHINARATLQEVQQTIRSELNQYIGTATSPVMVARAVSNTLARIADQHMIADFENINVIQEGNTVTASFVIQPINQLETIQIRLDTHV